VELLDIIANDVGIYVRYRVKIPNYRPLHDPEDTQCCSII
jgi:hypothetical protein